jgi:hypothetical protein
LCNKHYNEHQEELAKEMDYVTQKNYELLSHLTMKRIDSEHPLLVRINKWEQQSIDRICAVANEARTDLKLTLDQLKPDIKTSLNQVTDQLKISCTSQDYTEIELKCCMDQLKSLKKRLLNPTEIELCGDTDDDKNASVIRLIELRCQQTVENSNPTSNPYPLPCKALFE